MKQLFVSGTVWTSAAAWIEQASNFIIFVLIARLIGTEAFGLAAMSLVFIMFGEVLVRETLTEGIIQRPTIEDGYLEAVFAGLTGFGLIILVTLAVFSQIAAAIYNEAIVAALILTASPVVLLIAISGVSTALLRRSMAFRVLAMRSIAGVVAGGAAGLALAIYGYGAWSLVGQRLVTVFVNSVAALIAARWIPIRLPRRADFSLITGLGPRVVILRAATLAMLQMPTIVLGVAIGPHAVSLYALAWRLIEVLMTLIVAPIKSVAQSAIAAMQRENEATDEFFITVTQLVALVGFTSFGGVALLANPALSLMFGPEWSGTLLIIPWLCFAGAIQVLSQVQESYLIALDQSRKYIKAVVFEAIFSIALIILASTYGVVFVAAAVALRTALFFPVRVAIALAPEQISVARYAHSILIPCFIAIGMSLAVGLWRRAAFGHMPDIVYVTLAILIGIVTFGVILATFTPGILARMRSLLGAEHGR